MRNHGSVFCSARQKDNALLLDCNKIHHNYIPFELDDYRLVIMNSKSRARLFIQNIMKEKVSAKKHLEYFIPVILNTKIFVM